LAGQFTVAAIATDAVTSSVIAIVASKAIVRLICFSFFSGNPSIAFSGLRPFAYGYQDRGRLFAGS
jgi:hypothetical protein